MKNYVGLLVGILMLPSCATSEKVQITKELMEGRCVMMASCLIENLGFGQHPETGEWICGSLDNEVAWTYDELPAAFLGCIRARANMSKEPGPA
jgi:hypothetical protein